MPRARAAGTAGVIALAAARFAGDAGDAGMCMHNSSPRLSREAGFWLRGARNGGGGCSGDRTPEGTRAAPGTRLPVAEVRQ